MNLERLKAGFAFAGMAAAVAGVGLGQRVIVWVAMGLLGVALALRIWIRRGRRAESSGEEASAPRRGTSPQLPGDSTMHP